MTRKKFLIKGLILIGAYLIFALYLIAVSERIERLNELHQEQTNNFTQINISK